MSSTIVVLDVEVEAIAWVSGNQGLRVRTRRWARPTRARFDAWLSIGWPSLEIDFVWCPPLERRVRTMFVVPIGERKKLAARLLTTQRDQHSSRALDLHRLDHALNHSDAAVLTDCSIARRLDAPTFDPAAEALAVEDAVPVTDDVLGRSSHATNRSAQEGANGTAIRPRGKDADVHDTA